ncbi:cation diffusion facilitator family transporter [Candidatus Anaplasma sp. TIGMIC]|uniref:cation diffusion facilitator family transporter n=1 Tax=Candidatus Anaplasma sp. TIGMIC TaxID=3020713 RepID=UPI0023301C1D|nr:cation diffusion facilitator family transporter [Candidatus Anaplasma sp. TIGMIC]MDB1135783.1 cation diffusion facilitator family transporter [Candidatus Anaplasma sp. TIGMIC]
MTSCDSQYSSGMHVRMIVAIVVISFTLIAETIGGVVSNSLALLSDAGHVLTDLVALILSCVAFRLTTKSADTQRSYGYHRFQVMAAFVNGVSLLVIAALMTVEAIHRFIDPVEVDGQLMLYVAVFGFVANVAVFFIMYRKNECNLNVQSALLHVVGDLLGSVAAIVSSIVIQLSGWQLIDPLLTVAISFIMVYSAFRVVKNSSNILLEGKPYDIDIEDVKTHILSSVAGIIDVHHVHLWSLTADYPIMTMHVKISGTEGAHSQPLFVVKTIKKLLRERFGITHITIEVETGECSDANVESPE